MAGADDLSIKPGAYEIASQIVMPHLEEMRRITKRELRCLRGDEPSALFPVMDQRALTGCELGYAARDADVFHYVMVCQSDLVATGTAEFNATPNHVSGTLNIKMGGKNMTFSQHVKATWQGACDHVKD